MNNRIGFHISILTGAMSAITFVVAYLTEPLSGPFCFDSCFKYPYLDIASRFPADYIWMYFAIIWLFLYIIFMICIHIYAKKEENVFGYIGLVFAVMSTLILLVNYYVQISVIQPSLLKGELDGISLVTQYNPHGIFIVLEEIGFILMSISFLFTALIFDQKGLEKGIRWIFLCNFILMIISFTTISFVYGIDREYIFEIAIITINWLTLILSGILFSLLFKKEKDLDKISGKELEI